MALDQFFYENPIPCWIYSVDDLRIIAVNESACRSYEYTEEEMLNGMTILELRPASDRSALILSISEGCKNKKPYWKHMDKHGNIFHVDINSFQTTVNGRKCRYVMAVNVEEKITTERRNQQLANRFENQRNNLSQLLGSLREMIWTCKPEDFSILYMSPAITEVLGYQPNDVINKPLVLSGLVHTEDIATVDKAIIDLFETGQCSVECRMFHKDGNIRLIRHECFLLKDKSGKPIKINCLSFDKTEQWHTEIKLSETSRSQNEPLENLSDALYLLDENWNFTFINKACETLYKADRSLILGKNIWECFSYTQEMKYYTAFHEAVKYQQIREFEEYSSLLPGWVHIKCYPLRGGLAVQCKDITEQKQMREKIDFDALNTRSLIDNTDDLIWSVDRKLQLLSFNKAYMLHAIQASGEAPLTGQKEFMQNVNCKECHSLKEYYLRALSGETFKICLQCNPGSYSEYRFSPVIDSGGKITAVSCFLRDISKEVIYLRQIGQQNNQMKEVAWLQSHKMRALVATIMGLMQLVNKDNWLDKDNEFIMENVASTTNQLDDCIRMITKHAEEALNTDMSQRVEIDQSILNLAKSG